MYIRTPRACVWLDDPSPLSDRSRPAFAALQPQPPSLPPFAEQPPVHTRGLDGIDGPPSTAKPSPLWTGRPLSCPAGLCVALREGTSGIEVGVRDAQQRLRWHAVLSVMSAQQLQRWLAGGGFKHP